MPFLPLFTGIRHLAHVLSVPPTKAWLLCATPTGIDLYIQAMPVCTYRVQSPGFPKIVYSSKNATLINSFIFNAQSSITNQLSLQISYLSIYQVGIFVWIASFSWTQTFEHMVSAGTDLHKFTSKPQCSAHTMIQFMLFSLDTQQSHSFTNSTNKLFLLIQSFW